MCFQLRLRLKVYALSICLLEAMLAEKNMYRNLGYPSIEKVGSKRITTYPVQVPVLRYSSARKTMFRCRFLAILDVRTIYRVLAKHASPVEWCLNEEVELLCKLAMPRLSSGV